MTRQGRRDSTLRQWWDAMAPLIIERSRSMAAAAKDIEGLSNV